MRKKLLRRAPALVAHTAARPLVAARRRFPLPDAAALLALGLGVFGCHRTHDDASADPQTKPTTASTASAPSITAHVVSTADPTSTNVVTPTPPSPTSSQGIAEPQAALVTAPSSTHTPPKAKPKPAGPPKYVPPVPTHKFLGGDEAVVRTPYPWLGGVRLT